MSVTYPHGFAAGGQAVGLRKSGRKDLAIVQNLGPDFTAAGVFTTNRVFAAPVALCRERLLAGPNPGQARAVVINSGNANACTGPQGQADAAAMSESLAGALGVPVQDTLVASTGIIGELLDMPTVLRGIQRVAADLGSDLAHGQAAAEAILTTDTHLKTVQQQCPGGYRLGGMAKGAGMLAPALATMICVVTTDAVLSPETAQTALENAVAQSFNCLDSDGCMSTNDTVLLLASGASGRKTDTATFTKELTQACQNLAQQLLGDAEGANHDVKITVSGATTRAGALTGARAISRSNLVKTAIYGNDPNWGRILSQLGTVSEEDLPFDPAQVDVTINGVMICQGGQVGQDRDLVDMRPRQCEITVELHAGSHSATVWTSDLTHEYVHINGDYTT